jgi:GNAT superfamily N-acetyltransferase
VDTQPLLQRFSALRRARARTIEAAGVQTFLDFGGAWGLLDPASVGWYPSQNANRIVDLGCDGRTDVEGLTEPFALAALPRFFVYLDPYPVIKDAHRNLHQAGFRMCNEISVLVHNLTTVPSVSGHVIVREATAEDVADLNTVLSYEGAQEPMWEDKVTGVLGQDGVAVYLAYQADAPIAVGVLNWTDGVGYLSNATTVPAHRGKGAQKALIAARLKSAGERGCDLAYVETYRFLQASYDNLTKAGFEELYARLIYRYEFDPSVRESLVDTVYGHEPPSPKGSSVS